MLCGVFHMGCKDLSNYARLYVSVLNVVLFCWFRIFPSISDVLWLGTSGRLAWHRWSRRFLGLDIVMRIWAKLSWPFRVVLYVWWIFALLISFGYSCQWIKRDSSSLLQLECSCVLWFILSMVAAATRSIGIRSLSRWPHWNRWEIKLLVIVMKSCCEEFWLQ